MNITNANYFTFNVDNSAFITGQTGSGKSFLIEQLIKRYAKGKTSEDIQFAFFDFKQVEFGYWVNHPEEDEFKIADKLYCPVITDSEEALGKLEELAELSRERAKNNVTKPQIFIAIDECDAACVDTNRFSNALITINENAKDANMKLLYDTSRPSPEDVIPKRLLDSFDLVLAGQLASKIDADYLGVPYQENIEQYGFIIA
jgi:DNA segregation ATPase FtsK/SpoIIIE-like protein